MSTDGPDATAQLGVAVYVLRQILRATTDGVWIIDTAGCTVYANRQVAETLDLAAIPVPGHAELFTAIGMELSSLLLRPDHLADAGCHEFRFGADSYRHLRVADYPFLSARGRMVGRILVFNRVRGDGTAVVARVLRPLVSQIDAPSAPAVSLSALDHGLTARESQIAALLLRDRGLAGIADDLDLSVNTVRSQIGRMFRKFGVHSQPALRRKLDNFNTGGTIGVSGIRRVAPPDDAAASSGPLWFE